MTRQDVYERIMASLYDAMLDDTHWPATSALIDEACGLTGNALLVAEGPPDDIRVLFVGLYYRGQRRLDLEREYLDVYHPINEAIPRQLQLPVGQLVPIPDLYTAEELKTSPTYNEALPRYKYQHGLNVLLDGPGGSRMTWSLADPVASDGWGSSEIAMVRRLMPHIRQFIRVRQALGRAEAGDTTVTALLDNPRIGVLHLDRRGQIIEVNDRARSILRLGDGLSDRDGVLGARNPDDQLRLEGLVAAALPVGGAIAVSGSMLLGRSSGSPPFVVHVKPAVVPQPDYGARHVAALVLIVEPGSQHRIDPGWRAGCPQSGRPAPPRGVGGWPRYRSAAPSQSAGRCCWAARPGSPPFVVHVKPAVVPQPDYGARHVARAGPDCRAESAPEEGQQEGRFFHGYYRQLPLYIFSGEHLLCARLRCSTAWWPRPWG